MRRRSIKSSRPSSTRPERSTVSACRRPSSDGREWRRSDDSKNHDRSRSPGSKAMGKSRFFSMIKGMSNGPSSRFPSCGGSNSSRSDGRSRRCPASRPRICGVCPTAHHMASTKAVDAVFHVEPTPTARKIRELIYNAFMMEDHTLHFFFLGGPDFVVGPRPRPPSATSSASSAKSASRSGASHSGPAGVPGYPQSSLRQSHPSRLRAPRGRL